MNTDDQFLATCRSLVESVQEDAREGKPSALLETWLKWGEILTAAYEAAKEERD